MRRKRWLRARLPQIPSSHRTRWPQLLDDKRWPVLFDDKRNCFNNQDRGTNLDELYQSTATANTWGIADFAYGGAPTVIVYRGDNNNEPLIIWSEQGARQGCTIGSLTTCYGLIPTNNSIIENLDIEVISVIDDSTFICPDWFNALTAYDRSLACPNIEINTEKTKILWPHESEPPAGLIEGCTKRGLQLVLRSAKTLGGMLGCNDQAAIDHNLKQVNSHQPLLDALTHPKMPPQVATGLLRVCASNKFNYLARLHPPRHTLQAALLFDERRIEAFNKICDISPPLPRNFTNNYIFDSVLCFRLAINTIVPAFYAASVVAAHSDPSLFEHSSDNMPPHIQHFQHAWQTLINFGLPVDTQPPVNANGIPTRNALATLPQDFNSIPEFYHPSLSADDPAKIQRSLSPRPCQPSDANTSWRSLTTQPSHDLTASSLRVRWPCSPLTTFTAREWKEAVKFITNSPLDASLSTDTTSQLTTAQLTTSTSVTNSGKLSSTTATIQCATQQRVKPTPLELSQFQSTTTKVSSALDPTESNTLMKDQTSQTSPSASQTPLLIFAMLARPANF